MNLTDSQPLPYHAVIWMDHRLARVIHFDHERQVCAGAIHAHHTPAHLHHKANSIGSGHARVDAAFMRDIVLAVGNAGSILLTGPGSAKHDWQKYVQEHHPQVSARIVRVQPLDHLSDGELLAFARKAVHGTDLMGSQSTRQGI